MWSTPNRRTRGAAVRGDGKGQAGIPLTGRRTLRPFRSLSREWPWPHVLRYDIFIKSGSERLDLVDGAAEEGSDGGRGVGADFPETASPGLFDGLRVVAGPGNGAIAELVCAIDDLRRRVAEVDTDFREDRKSGV